MIEFAVLWPTMIMGTNFEGFVTNTGPLSEIQFKYNDPEEPEFFEGQIRKLFNEMNVKSNRLKSTWEVWSLSADQRGRCFGPPQGRLLEFSWARRPWLFFGLLIALADSFSLPDLKRLLAHTVSANASVEWYRLSFCICSSVGLSSLPRLPTVGICGPGT